VLPDGLRGARLHEGHAIPGLKTFVLDRDELAGSDQGGMRSDATVVILGAAIVFAALVYVGVIGPKPMVLDRWTGRTW
jgi:hypothetical protein